MIHMLCRFDLKPGQDAARFAGAYSQFVALLKSEDLIVEGGPVGQRISNTPMDTDAPDAPNYYAVVSFRDRAQLDASYARFMASMAGHESVLAGISDSVFTCWSDLSDTR